MTQSKLTIAKRLAELRQDGSDPEALAKTMTVMKMHHEIEKILEAREAEAPPEEPPTPAEPAFRPLILSVFDAIFGSDRD